MTRRAPLTAFVVAVTCAALAPAAHAFNCTRVGSDGPSLFWRERRVVLQRSGAGHEVDAAQIDGVMQRAADTWTAIDCSDVEETVGAPTTDPLAGFDWAAGAGSPKNHNIVVFRDDDPQDPIDAWEHELGALAITTVTFESNEGRLLDADVEVNDAGFSFTACDPADCQPQFDLENTLTHEFGHVLGLDHTDVAEATMFPSAPEGDLSKRSLAEDDIDAVCTIYPAGADIGECYGVARSAPPRVRFSPTFCGQGPASAPIAACWGLLAVIRFRRNRAIARRAHPRSCRLDDDDVRLADLPGR